MKRETLTDKKAEDFVETLTNTRKEFFLSGMKFVEDALLFCATESEAKRFYISAEEAARKVSKYEKTGNFGVCGREKNRMYAEIYQRFRRQREKWTEARSKLDILEDVVSSPAPSFYISLSSARQLVRRHYITQRNNKQ